MKTILLILLTSCVAMAQSKEPVDSIAVYTPTKFQLEVIQGMQDNLVKQIEELKKQVNAKQTEYILFGFGEAVDPKTLKFDGKKFKAVKQK